jgi:hypothetical protein
MAIGVPLKKHPNHGCPCIGNGKKFRLNASRRQSEVRDQFGPAYSVMRICRVIINGRKF